jgi:hypothetical protein
MKNLLTKLKNKLRLAWQWIAGESSMIWHWIKNLFFVFLTTKSEPHIFQGYGHFWFAKIYANRRTKISKINKYCGGKWHYVIPAGEYSLIVLSSDEIRTARKKGMLNKNMQIEKILKSAYYVSTDQNSKPKIKK